LQQSGLFERITPVTGQAKDFAWLQATTSRHTFTTDHARAIASQLTTCGIEDLGRFFTHTFVD